MTHLNRHVDIYDYRDPACLDTNPEEEEELWEREVDKEIDERLEREALEDGK